MAADTTQALANSKHEPRSIGHYSGGVPEMPMERLMPRLKLGQWVPLAIIAAIFFLSFITFNVLFQATSSDGYFNEIIAALIGTILAAVVTTMLLRSQTQGEELKERNVEVFRKKVEAYEAFVELSLRLLDDHQLSNDEASQLRRSVYKLSLFSSEDTVKAVSGFVRAQYLQDNEYSFSEVMSAFRKELALERVDELADIDLDVIDDLLRRGGSRTHIEAVQTTLTSFAEKLLGVLTVKQPELFAEAEFDEAVGVGHQLFANLVCPSGTEVGFSIEYDAATEQRRLIEVGVDLSELAFRPSATVRQLCLSLGFEDERDEDSPNEPGMPVALVDASNDAAPVRVFDDRRVWTLDEFSDALIRIELGAREAVKPSQRQNK